MKAVKGFGKDLTCRGFQYAEGKTFEHVGAVDVCRAGFHAVTLPLDVLKYYPLRTPRMLRRPGTPRMLRRPGTQRVSARVLVTVTRWRLLLVVVLRRVLLVRGWC